MREQDAAGNQHEQHKEQGQHDDLLARKGLYYAMWRQQVGERRAVAVPTAAAAPGMAVAGD